MFWVADVLTDVIYATDMVVQMNISYIDDGIYVSFPKKKTLKRYEMVSLFKLDGTCCRQNAVRDP